MSRFSSFCVVLLVLIAGCTGPVQETSQVSARSESTTKADTDVKTTTEDSSGLREGLVGVNETDVFRKVKQLLSVEASSPALTVRRNESLRRVRSTPSQFARVLGVTSAMRDQASPVRGRTTRNGVIELSVSEAADATDVRTLLVHEYVHSIQLQRASYQTVRRVGVESSMRARLAVTEGAAVYVTQQYAARHDGVRNQRESVCEMYDDGAPATKLALNPYCVGAHYIEDRVDSADEIAAVYEDPPRTTEQVRHGLDPSTEPARPMAVAAKSTEEWTVTNAGLPTGLKRQGELWTYTVLTTYLPEGRADRAATGWGNDTVVKYGNGSETNWVWVTRWDDPDEADEFSSAMQVYVEAAEANATTDAAFELVRANETVVVLVTGSEAFVTEASIAMDEGTVVLRPPDGRTNSTPPVVRSPNARTDSTASAVEHRAPRSHSSVGIRNAIDPDTGPIEQVDE